MQNLSQISFIPVDIQSKDKSSEENSWEQLFSNLPEKFPKKILC